MREIKVTFNQQEVAARLQKRVERCQLALDQQIVKDSNYYCPMRDGQLMRSVLSSANGQGLLIWATDYARAQYYGLPNKSKDSNPNASTKWFEVAKAAKLKEWEALVNREYNK